MINDTVQIQVTGTSGTDVIDLSGHLSKALAQSGLINGLLTVHAPGSTAAVTTIEYEPGAVSDLLQALERIAPQDGEYAHNLKWHDGNGYSHVRAALMGPTLSIPVNDGQLCLGAWQQVILLDFDNKPRTREVVIQALGE
jgi:secondary thiamine-phosphate synthase enzyme